MTELHVLSTPQQHASTTRDKKLAGSDFPLGKRQSCSFLWSHSGNDLIKYQANFDDTNSKLAPIDSSKKIQTNEGQENTEKQTYKLISIF